MSVVNDMATFRGSRKNSFPIFSGEDGRKIRVRKIIHPAPPFWGEDTEQHGLGQQHCGLGNFHFSDPIFLTSKSRKKSAK
jgi:hypothetical protein